MLITNFRNNHIAKVAFKANKKSKDTILEFANNMDGFPAFELAEVNDNKQVLVVMDCNVVLEEVEDVLVINDDIRETFISLSALESTNSENLKNIISNLSSILSTSKIHVDEDFEQRYLHVKSEVEKEKKKAYGGYNSGKTTFNNSTTPRQGSLYKDDWNKFGDNVGEMEISIPYTNKSISSLTDAEWAQLESENTYGPKGERDAFIIINYILDKHSRFPNATNPIASLLLVNDTLKSKSQVNNWVWNFEIDFKDQFELQCPGAKEEDYINILEAAVSFLKAYKYNRLVKEIVETLEKMIDRELSTYVS